MIVALASTLVGAAAPAGASTLLSLHQGAKDPTTEGFTFSANFGPASTGPLPKDMGHAAWYVSSGSNTTQAFYFQGFTAAQNQAVAAHGFTLSLLARVPQGPENAPGANFYPSAVAAVDFGTPVRFDLDLGRNTNGDTVVVLADHLINGPDFYVTGASYTLTGSGSTYHSYRLVYSPKTLTAKLYVDGVLRISGYKGEGDFFDSGGTSFGAVDGGQGNYSSVRVTTPLPPGALAPVPEPSSLATSALGALLLLACIRRGRRPAA
jgi:hypothetical protein